MNSLGYELKTLLKDQIVLQKILNPSYFCH